MIVMPADNGSREVYLWQGRYGSLGWLLSAYAEGAGTREPWREMPYAIDNGIYGAFSSGALWSHRRFYRGLDRIALAARMHRHAPRMHRHAPRWVVVPDAVGDARATLRRWALHAPHVRRYGWPLAFAVQDGMTRADVPEGADVVFVGGTTDWKERTLGHWCAHFPRVHVGRVNGYRMLRASADFGAESCDGTGWFRGGEERWAPLLRFLREEAGEIATPQTLFHTAA